MRVLIGFIVAMAAFVVISAVLAAEREEALLERSGRHIDAEKESR